MFPLTMSKNNLQSCLNKQFVQQYHCCSKRGGVRSRQLLVQCTVEQKKINQRQKDVYPPFEESSIDEGPFPVRHPGNYPSAHIHPITAEPYVPEDKYEEVEFDPLRDGPLRFLGYANELGEAFAAWLPVGGVPLSYAVAIGYVLTDTVDKGRKALKEASDDLKKIQQGDISEYEQLINLLGAERALDTIVWQLLASVAIPGATIHFVVALTHYLLTILLGMDSNETMDPQKLQMMVQVASLLNTDVDTVVKLVLKSVPTFAGLTAIPFIVHPIDNGVHALLNHTLRPAMRVFICDTAGGRESGLEVCDVSNMSADFPVLTGQGPLGKVGENLMSRTNLSSQNGKETKDDKVQDKISDKQNGFKLPSSTPSGDLQSKTQSQTYKFQNINEESAVSKDFSDCEMDGCGVLYQYRQNRDQGLYHGSLSQALLHALLVGVPMSLVFFMSYVHTHEVGLNMY
eukprot:TRINITY_DN2131_c0_g1_i3.p1 TRINITY_DN2131_c0_g1~~TRINITY_DN2131_c0_g1_i3.p1  ORF type:complete len:472 (-),score=62.78 TRINITY_DN2131_c0_g1_i3:172-1542(-)